MKIDSEIFNHQLASKAEEIGCLPQEWLNLAHQNNWFKLFVPAALGGLNYSLPQVLRIEEQLSYTDGSLGWTVTLCAGAAWFVGFLDQQLAAEIFAHPKVCLAGSGFIGGKANLINNQYLINGSWTYASGALHATHFTANCLVYNNGKPILDVNGNHQVKAFILNKDEVEILDGWSYMGMVATGSHAFKAQNQTVPLNRSFQIIPEKVVLKDPSFQYPFLQLAETTLVVNVLGITLHFIELLNECFWIRHEKRNYDDQHLNYYKTLYHNQIGLINKVKIKFYQAVDQSWLELTKDGEISPSILKSVSKASRNLAGICRISAAELHPFAGLEAAKTHTEINRVWRDMNTVSQHSLLIFPF